MEESHIELFIEKYIKDGNTVALGASEFSDVFLKKLAIKMLKDDIQINFVPTSAMLAHAAAELKLPIVSLNEREVDVAVEFADVVDKEFNFTKLESSSLIRDKMIAESAANLIIVAKAGNLKERLSGKALFEISSFGYKHTLAALENFGKSKLRMQGKEPFKTETKNYLAEVEVDELHNIYEIGQEAKKIPGVLETGIFIGYADTLITHNGKIDVKSRLKF